MDLTQQQEAQFFKQQAQNDLLSFSVYTDKFFDIVKIHEVMADALMKVESGEIKKLILELPPRSWKSRISWEFIAWLMWRNPNKDVLLTGHSSSLLETFSRNIRNRINSTEYQSLFETKLAEWNTAVKSWKTDKWWEFSIFWVGGGITWKWWHYIFIDDPYSWREEAESQTIKDKVWDWYKSTLLSRKQNDNSAIILIMQRWAEDDLAWRILEADKKWEWTEIKIPAINEKWESFWPEKFSIKYLQEMKNEIWEYFFSSQYQQDPLNLGSWAFIKEYFEYSNILENRVVSTRLNIISFLDPAISKKQEADFTWLVTIWHDPNSNLTYILEVKQLKEQPDEIINAVFATSDKFKNHWTSYRMWIEVVQYQKMLALEIQKQMRIRDKFFTLEEVRPQWEKEARILSTLQGRYSTKSVLHSLTTDNIGELESELLKFPNWKHDDLIDALSWAVALMTVNSIWDENEEDEYITSDNDTWYWFM